MFSLNRFLTLGIFLFTALLCGAAAFSGQLQAAGPGAADLRVQAQDSYSRLPLYFIANRGQVNERVKYYVQGQGQTTFFTKDEVLISLASGGSVSSEASGVSQPGRKPRPMIVRLQPLGMKRGVKLAALEPQEHRVNYFRGNNPEKWRTEIPTYQAVVYREAYPGIDLKFYGRGDQLEYDIVVRPGADPSRVTFAYEGVQKLEVTPAGDLALHLPDGGVLRQQKPVIYQEIAGQRLPVEGKFRVRRQGAQLACGFALAAYDRRHPLVIDPVLAYSTYLGGTSNDFGQAIAVDAAGCAYVTGYTYSDHFPTQNPFQADWQGWYDVFVSKFNAAGNALVYSTYLGGSSLDWGYGIAVDAAGCAHLAGHTVSDNFPTQYPFQSARAGGCDAFVTKLSAAGNTLVYSTFLGGSGDDYGYSIKVDAAGCAFLTGSTASANFPIQNPYQGTKSGSGDAFITKFNAAGNALVYSTFLGGTGNDFGNGIALDAAGCAYVTGETASGDFPILNPYQGTYGGGWADAFITKFSAAGNVLVYSTFLGGSGGDNGRAIAVDPTGNAYVTGMTQSTNFPLQNPFQNLYAGSNDAFVTKLSPVGGALAFSTYLGGSNFEFAYGIAVDAAGCPVVTGSTNSANFPLLNPLQGYGKATDAFITRFSASGGSLVYSTYLGGSGGEEGYGIAVDSAGWAYVVGYTTSADFPIKNPYQGTLAGLNDVFVSKIGTPASSVGALLPLLLE